MSGSAYRSIGVRNADRTLKAELSIFLQIYLSMNQETEKSKQYKKQKFIGRGGGGEVSLYVSLQNFYQL